MIEDYGTILDNGIRATAYSYPNRNMSKQIQGAIKEYISIINKNNMDFAKANKMFRSCFTRIDLRTDKPIRDNFKSDKDSVLDLLDYMFRHCLDKLSESRIKKLDDNYISAILEYVNSYTDIVNVYRVTNLSDARSRIYANTTKIELLIQKLEPILDYYVDNTLNKTNQTIRITEITDTGKQLFTNINDITNCNIKDSFQSVYKSGNTTIQMASTLGYKNRKKTQQDAMLSCSKDGTSMNIVADGAGGSDKGQIASTMTVYYLKRWFDSHDFSVFNNISPDNNVDISKASREIIASLNIELKNIDAEIKRKHQGSFSTVVISIVTPGFVLFANVGDSTAYVYDADKKTLEEKSVLDSLSRGLSYEAARHNPRNNQITNGMGMMKGDPHFNVMPNKGAYRIILSSDGVTDLISKDNFNYLASQGYGAVDFVNKADQLPDVTKGMKSQDNISAIVIDSDEYNKKRRVR